MYYFDNFGYGAYAYLALHGSYGFCWLLKEIVFPDAGFAVKVTFLSFITAFVGVLGPYWVAAYILISSSTYVSPLRLCTAVMIYAFGLVLMMGADTQKFFVLKVKKGLISNGWFRYCRNPNYLGEIMIYSSFAILSQHYIPWLIYTYIWGLVFVSNWALKEESYKKKAGWDEYKNRSNLLTPSFLGWWNDTDEQVVTSKKN